MSADNIRGDFEFDGRLLALADCPVLEHKEAKKSNAKGGIVFNPHPVITATNNEVLAHEVCHRLAGKSSYDVFLTALKARDNNPLFKYLLNLLFDWYDERNNENLSGFLKSQVDNLHAKHPLKLSGKSAILDKLIRSYNGRISIYSMQKRFKTVIRDEIDLVRIADVIFKEVEDGQVPIAILFGLMNEFNTNGAGSDIGNTPKRSDYYIKAVARYYHIITDLVDMWKRNKYSWVNNYYGEINWKDLVGLFVGSELMLPVFRIFSKIIFARSVYLVVDRSGSTGPTYNDIENVIMDTAVIIAESLRMIGAPISVLDVGVTNDVVNKIDEDLDLGWFTPTSDGGTPLGQVCSLIKDADIHSYLLIITDGEPDNWEDLTSALHRFPGQNLTFVIGSSYASYASHVKNVISVEPHTIIREMITNESYLT